MGPCREEHGNATAILDSDARLFIWRSQISPYMKFLVSRVNMWAKAYGPKWKVKQSHQKGNVRGGHKFTNDGVDRNNKGVSC